MEDKLKSFIITDITKTVYYMKSIYNSKLSSIIIFNNWARKNINIKITDTNFIVYLLNYIDDILLINNSLLKEIIKFE